jgi:hypothetical protein
MRLIITVVLVLLSSSTQSADKTGSYAIIGSGTASCGKYVEARKSDSDGNYRAWLAGYISALNLMTKDTYNVMGETDTDGMMLWIENYCTGNPLKRFESAAQAVSAKLLPTRKRRAD